MGFKHYLRLILRQIWIIILLMVVVLASTYFFTQSQPVSYTAKTTIIINPRVPNSLLPYADSTANYTASLAQNYTLIMQSTNFAARVAQKLGFPINIDTLKNSYTSALLPNSLFFIVTATSNTPDKAVKIANEVTNLFLSEGIAQSNSSSNSNDVVNSTIQFQRDELTSLQKEITSVKDQIAVLQQATPSAETAQALSGLRNLLTNDLTLQSDLVASVSNYENNANAAPQASASLVDSAQGASVTGGGSLVRNLILAAILSIVLGVGIIILMDYLDYTVRSSEELATLTGLSTLGSVPVLKPAPTKPTTKFAADSSDSGAGEGEKSNKYNFSSSIITAIEFKTPASESYRVLRTNILFSSLGKESSEENPKTYDNAVTLDNVNLASGAFAKEDSSGIKTLMITSALPQEGKSLTAANLAVAFAQTGNRVVLIDADMRLPTIHKLFNMENESGFSDLLISKQVQFEKYVRGTPITNLFVITAGTTPPNPSELLTNSRTIKVINALRKVADIVIFDSPPTMLASDASVLASRVDSVLLVVRASSTRRDTVLKTINRLKKVSARLTGTVLNRVSSQEEAGYYSYNYSGYGYGENGKDDNKDKKSKSASKEKEKSAIG